MPDWPHSPLHRLADGGAYIVTVGTYRRQPFFHSAKRLTLLCEELFRISAKRGIELQAWAVFPNHYHFVAHLPDPHSLRPALSELHTLTARALNEIDRAPGRKVWFQFWETHITHEKSYFARLHYVHENPVHHGVALRSVNYPWCSAAWFEQKATPALRETIYSFPFDRVSIVDPYEVTAKDFSQA
jgi:putative transposase